MIDLKKTGITILSIFTIFIVWVIGYAVVSNPLLLPSPLEVLKAFFGLFTTWKSLLVMLMTFVRLLIALLFAFLLGFILGIWSGFNKNVATFWHPIVTIFRTIPVISIIVILLIWFGFTLTPYVITFLMIFPIIYQAVYEGIINIDTEMVDVYKLEDNRLITGLKHCYIPLINTQIKTALLQSAGLGIKVLVMAEYLSQTKTSIGNSLYLAKVTLEFDQVFAWTILLILMAIVLSILIERYSLRNSTQPIQKSKVKSSERLTNQ